jgi:predicted nucleotide-binding protein
VDSVIDDLIITARKCERAAGAFEAEPLAGIKDRLLDAATSLAQAWSGSWIGYHASLYINGLRPRRPDEVFDPEFGLMESFSNQTVGDWQEYTQKAIEQEILRRAELVDLQPLLDAARAAREVFDRTMDHVIPTLDALLAEQQDTALQNVRKKVEEIKSCISRQAYFDLRRPNQFVTRDHLASSHGIQVPPHFAVEAHVIELASHGLQLKKLATEIKRTVTYLQQRHKMKGTSVARTDGKIFIGHGRSPVWKDLREFLREDLDLEPDEFNGQPTAGMTTKERLEQMLDDACFAFLVMTAEDEAADGTLRARENVVHEAGLFQGRLGFRRAILLLEEGCHEFSNIQGLTQIRFPTGNLNAVREEIRKVMRRESIIK